MPVKRTVNGDAKNGHFYKKKIFTFLLLRLCDIKRAVIKVFKLKTHMI